MGDTESLDVCKQQHKCKTIENGFKTFENGLKQLNGLEQLNGLKQLKLVENN